MALQNRSLRKSRLLVENLEPRLLLSAIPPGTPTNVSYTGLQGGNNGIPRPNSLIADASGNIFGTTQAGGPLNYGTVFEIPAGTNDVLTLAGFDNTSGVLPEGNLVLDANGNLFGAASGGGTQNRGTLWELKKGDRTITNLWNFTGGNGGAYPGAGIVADAAGNLWGTTFGNNENVGTVFEFTPPTVSGTGTGLLQTLAVLPQGAHLNSTLAVGTDGKLVKNGGFVYGTLYTVNGNTAGEIFQLGIRPRSGSTAGNVGAFTILGNFDSGGNDASLPVGTLLFLKTSKGKGELVGITVAGGSDNSGVLYQATLPAGHTPMQISDLASFTNTNTVGRNPIGTLLVAQTGSGSYVLTGVTAFGATNANGGVFRTRLNTTAAGKFRADTVAQFGGSFTGLTDQTGINPTGGVAIGRYGDIYMTTANNGSLNNGSVVQISTTPAGPDRLQFSSGPGNRVAGTPQNAITVKAFTSNGQLDTSANGPVTLEVANGLGVVDANGTLSNPLNVTATMVAGVAVFSNVTISQEGTYSLRATTSRRETTQSNLFTISPAAASKLVILQQPTGGSAGRALGRILVALEDQYGNILTNNGVQITLSAKGGSLSNASASTNKGIATFNNVIPSGAGTYTLTANTSSLKEGATFQPITVLNTPTAMSFASVPARAVVGTSFTIRVNVNKSGNVPVTLSLASSPRGATFSGTLTVMAVNGVAVFSDLMLFSTGVYHFKAVSQGLATIISSPLNLITLAQSNRP